MGDKSAIAWTDATWNPVIGCTKVSAGCTNCYAIKTAHGLDVRFHQPAYAGLTERHRDGSLNWIGEVRCLPERLGQPLRWQKPRRIFVNSMSDLFHDDVPDEFIDRVFAVMALAKQHTFQVLTKRPERMRRYFGSIGGCQRADFVFAAIGRQLNASRVAYPVWPLPNVWLGVSAEDQAAADARLPLLIQTPAAVRFVSAEPLLGPIDFSPWQLDLIITGGESGPGGRYLVEPCGYHKQLDYCVPEIGKAACVICGTAHVWPKNQALEWMRAIRDRCIVTNTSYFLKQWGGLRPGGEAVLDGLIWHQFPDVPPQDGIIQVPGAAYSGGYHG